MKKEVEKYCPVCGMILKRTLVRKGNQYSIRQENNSRNRRLERDICTSDFCTFTELIVSPGSSWDTNQRRDEETKDIEQTRKLIEQIPDQIYEE